MNFPHSATIQRSALVGTKYVFANIGTTQCFVQPINAEEVQLFGIVFSKGFKCYVPLTAEVATGDRIVYDTKTYGVKGVNAYPFSARIDHKKILLELL